MGENPGGRTGAGEYNEQLNKINRANRLKTLTTQDVNLDDDQMLLRNQYGLLECKLCKTLHKTEASYLAHTTGKAHKKNLERQKIFMAKREAYNGGVRYAPQPQPSQIPINYSRIGDPLYKVYREKDIESGELTILFEITYPEIKKHTSPRARIMSAFEQTVEPPDPKYQYVVFAAIPYNTIAIKIPNYPVIQNRTISDWKFMEKKFSYQITITGPDQ